MLNIQNGQHFAVYQSMKICHLAWLIREMWLKRQISVSSPNPEPLPDERLSDDLLKSSYPNDAPLFVYPVQLYSWRHFYATLDLQRGMSTRVKSTDGQRHRHY